MAQRAVFTDRLLKSLKPAPTGQRIVHWDAAKPSFGCPNHRSWRDLLLRHATHAGAGRSPSASPWAAIPISVSAQARALATAAIGDLVSGIHPKARRASRPRPLPRSPKPFLSPTRRRQAAHRDRDRKDGQPVSPAALGQRASRIEITPRRCHHDGRNHRRASGPYMAAKVLALASCIFRFGVTRELDREQPLRPHQDHGLRRRHGAAPAGSDRRRDRARLAGDRAKSRNGRD